MLKFKKPNTLAITLAIMCIFLLCSKAYAGAASTVADKTIDCTAKLTYYVTKYTLRAGWFITKKTARSITTVSKSMFRATKDAFSSNKQAKPVKTVKPADDDYYNNNTLPPPPPILE
ncbi:MAG: hypothetical protein A2Y25_06125 [Candidatus Melainabacteria bacterium GWF2_37_15]|nr:MAG: hypothetical protein A2Y25_06125 [Candidatus Melainabacteria bacterium GWF2_37_15]